MNHTRVHLQVNRNPHFEVEQTSGLLWILEPGVIILIIFSELTNKAGFCVWLTFKNNSFYHVSVHWRSKGSKHTFFRRHDLNWNVQLVWWSLNTWKDVSQDRNMTKLLPSFFTDNLFFLLKLLFLEELWWSSHLHGVLDNIEIWASRQQNRWSCVEWRGNHSVTHKSS